MIRLRSKHEDDTVVIVNPPANLTNNQELPAQSPVWICSEIIEGHLTKNTWFDSDRLEGRC